MRCPQCGEILWATTQTREIVSAYCEDCEEVWEWNRPQRRTALSGPSGCWVARWTPRRPGPAAVAGDQLGHGPAMCREAAWRGRLLRELEPAHTQPATVLP